MTREQFQSIEQQGGCVDLSRRAKFMLSGPDRVRYLNGQVTNDVRKADAGFALHACITNAKGRIEGDVFIHASQDGGTTLWLDAAPELREAMLARLERYIVADDVELSDETDALQLWHVFGKTSASLLSKAGTRGVLRAERFGADGADVWLPVSAPAAEWSALGVPLLTADEAETWRILQGIPAWPHELNADTFPQEAGLEATAMDYAKGCYIGQEVLSRIKMTGKMPKRLIRFALQSSPADAAGAPAIIHRDAGWKLGTSEVGGFKETGTVTSAAWHPNLDRWVGLGYVRQGFEAEDLLLLACGDPPRIFGKVEIFPS